MLLTEILPVRHVKLPLLSMTKTEVIAELLEVLLASGEVRDREAALTALLERERTHTTGIGGGLALPHAKTPTVGRLVMALGRSPGVDFESIDGKPVTLVALLLGPLDSTDPHIQALARISRLLSNDLLRRRIESATTPEQIVKIIAEKEKEESAAQAAAKAAGP